MDAIKKLQQSQWFGVGFLVILTLLCWAIFKVLRPETFGSPEQIMTYLQSALIYAVGGCGMYFIVTQGLWDFSIGSVLVLSCLLAIGCSQMFGIVGLVVAPILCGVLLGFFNDFSRKYNETDFLKRLYQMTYRPNDINIMVLDEVNISRVEYYFADFLSIMEYPIDKWKLRILQVPYEFEGPSHLENGVLKIPENTWFIGTANKDDSTYTITDKVYDRAITISFADRNEPFEVEGEVAPIHLTYKGLNALYAKALSTESNRLTKEDFARFAKLISFLSDTFDITFGNRVLNQIEILVPVYVSCGGTKEDALDFLFARKVLYKLEGRFEDYVRQGLLDLLDLIDETYGKEKFPLTRHNVGKLIKRL